LLKVEVVVVTQSVRQQIFYVYLHRVSQSERRQEPVPLTLVMRTYRLRMTSLVFLHCPA